MGWRRRGSRRCILGWIVAIMFLVRICWIWWRVRFWRGEVRGGGKRWREVREVGVEGIGGRGIQCS